MIERDYYYINEQNKTIEFTNDDSTENIPKKFTLGEILIHFLNSDFTTYDKQRKQFIHFVKHPSSSSLLDSNFYTPQLYSYVSSGNFSSYYSSYVMEFILYYAKPLFLEYNLTSSYDVTYFFDFSFDSLMEDKFDFLHFQNQLKEVIDFCFNVENNPKYSSLTCPQLLAIYSYSSHFKSGWLNQMPTLKSFELYPHSEDIVDKFFYKKEGDIYLRRLSKNLIKDISSIPYSLKEVYHRYDIPTLLFTEFMKIVELNMHIKKCKHCSSYFIPNGNYHALYCASCKKQGANHTYRNKVKSNEIITIYEKMYKKYYARRGKAGFTASKFLEWSENAKIVRNVALKTCMNPDKFRTIIDVPVISFTETV